MNQCIALFHQLTGHEPTTVQVLDKSGSNRKYIRLSGGNLSYIGVEGTSLAEVKAFVTMAKHFKEKQLPVPEVYLVSSDGLSYLQEDLGDQSLFESIRNGRETGVFSENEKDPLRKTIRQLADFQFIGAEGLDFSVCYPQPEFDKRTIFWDLNYFKYCFLKSTGIEFQEDRLENDFESLSEVLLENDNHFFMYRDFQSRNVLIRDDVLFFIDFQGGRKGPVLYDVASFLWQAKAHFPDELKVELLNIYLDRLENYLPCLDRIAFCNRLPYFVLFRSLQTLGAYGYRGYTEKKAHFLESIPFAIQQLKKILHNDFSACPYLCSVLSEMTLLKKFQIQPAEKILKVNIYSFAFKKGIPEDYSGNGGGYVFDCRAIPNPGKNAAFWKLSGLDQPVKEHLEKEEEMILFLEKIVVLASTHVEHYIQRGFTHLMFSFGCTGGQHRSVYAAQYLADHLSKLYPIRIRLEHRELGIVREDF